MRTGLMLGVLMLSTMVYAGDKNHNDHNTTLQCGETTLACPECPSIDTDALATAIATGVTQGVKDGCHAEKLIKCHEAANGDLSECHVKRPLVPESQIGVVQP